MPQLDSSVRAEESAVAEQRLPAAVLWDMDGTLIDTEPQWIGAEMALSRAHGGTWDEGLAMELIGKALTDSAALLRERAGIPLGDEELVEALIGQVVEKVRAGEAAWRPGAVELLAALRAAGVPCVLVTMSYARLADVVVDMLPPGSFAARVTGDMVTRGKPHPEPYLTAAERIGVDIADCVAIEDSVPGVASALASGARVLGVPAHVPLQAEPGVRIIETLARVAPTDLLPLTDPDAA
ncbi:HAD family phosphatase [Pseudactinotalea sp. HY158]|uniref:HAD family hydrolase n=1 Tax=Pseudactinotalea sp. HY158 TaxID=2654547 RepID=UPI001E30B3DC|nr:HAD family phosphatase [Pseudactinotalea sp. HY158]